MVKKLKYENEDDLNFDVYDSLNGLMGEFHAARMTYKLFSNSPTLTFEDQFHVKTMCWSHLTSIFFRLHELSYLAFSRYDFIDESLVQLISSLKSDDVIRLRNIFEHVADRKTDRFFVVEENNEVMCSVFIKYRKYFDAGFSTELMNLLGEVKDQFEQKFPYVKVRFEKRAIDFKVPSV